MDVLCHICHGERRILRRPPRFPAGPEDWLICPECHGKGTIGTDDGD